MHHKVYKNSKILRFSGFFGSISARENGFAGAVGATFHLILALHSSRAVAAALAKGQGRGFRTNRLSQWLAMIQTSGSRAKAGGHTKKPC
jgi:hypothetical protein